MNEIMTATFAAAPGARICVLMATWGEARFIARAIDSLLSQSLHDWELRIIDDASPDDTEGAVTPFLSDPRILYHRLSSNVGLGAALNDGLNSTRASAIAYLPADDVYYGRHLEELLHVLTDHPEALLAYSGVRHDYNRTSTGHIPGRPLQLVQCLHRRSAQRWIERPELVSDDPERLFWARLTGDSKRIGTGHISCEWVNHPAKLHRILQEPEGGVNTYRSRFCVRDPLRFHASTGNPIDEVALYRRQRERPDTPMADDGLKILLVGELAYNADRVLALEEAGHRLFGLWMEHPHWYNTVGPLPFGHVTDLPRHDWQTAIRRIGPDVIHAQLNWQTVPFAHHVLHHTPGIPFIWHFKEGPFISLEKGHWDMLIDLYRRSDGQIHVSEEVRDWLETVAPGLSRSQPNLIFDGDLPKRDWFDAPFARRHSLDDGALHTVVPGRPIGLHPHNVAELAEAGVHLHFYGDFTQGQWKEWIVKTQMLAPHHLHLHGNVDISNWVEEFSRYDAGWLHFFESNNEGNLRRANWDDLNLPARMATLAAAGLPMLQRDNHGHRVATQCKVRAEESGFFFRDMAGAADALRDTRRLETVRANVARERMSYTFDQHVPRLVGFMRKVIDQAAGRRTRH